MYMPSFPRSVRATLIIAIAWAIPWALGGAAFSFLLLRSRLGPFVLSPPELFRVLGMALLMYGIAGAAQGVLFALILWTIGRHWRRPLTGLSVALLGAIAGSTPPLVLIALLIARGSQAPSGASVIVPIAFVALWGALGALLAVATFAAAKHEALES
jgi:hypothetical protein